MKYGKSVVNESLVNKLIWVNVRLEILCMSRGCLEVLKSLSMVFLTKILW